MLTSLGSRLSTLELQGYLRIERRERKTKRDDERKVFSGRTAAITICRHGRRADHRTAGRPLALAGGFDPHLAPPCSRAGNAAGCGDASDDECGGHRLAANAGGPTGLGPPAVNRVAGG
jgi:hypothetical protein